MNRGWERLGRWLWMGLLLGLAACSIPFSGYEVDVLKRLTPSNPFFEGSFTLGSGGADSDSREVVLAGMTPTTWVSPAGSTFRTIGPIEVRYTPDSRVNLTGVVLDYKVCFTSENPEVRFSGSLTYRAYLSGDTESLFQSSNRLAEGSGDISSLSVGPICIEGQAEATPLQVQAFQRGLFYIGAEITGNATSDRPARVRYRTERFVLRLSGTVRP